MTRPTVPVIWRRWHSFAHLPGETWAAGGNTRGGTSLCGNAYGPVWNMAATTYNEIDRHGKVCSRCKASQRRWLRAAGVTGKRAGRA